MNAVDPQVIILAVILMVIGIAPHIVTRKDKSK
jgi:hypothetical protein